jgi:hypothetical protein
VSALYRFYPLADAFPPMRKWSKGYKALVKDIRAHGLREAIVLYQGMVLDGRNRYRACLETGVEPRFRQFDPVTEGDPELFVRSDNLHRRHLTSGQRAVLADRRAAGLRGGDRRSDQSPRVDFDRPPTVEQAAAEFGTSKSNVLALRAARAKVRPQVFQAVDDGRISVGRMGHIAKLTEDEQLEAVKDWEKIRDEHPELFEGKGKRSPKTDFAKTMRMIEALSDEDKERVGVWADLWRDERRRKRRA